MKHHFADLLKRDSGYWTIAPNRDRVAYRFENLLHAPVDTSILTITKHDLNWERIFDFKNLTELTLHDASKSQLEALNQLNSITALRITHARPKTLEFISSQTELKELVLEYVSGFNDLSPIQELSNLKSLHLENLRRVKTYKGLEGCNKLKYLSIDGTVDWKQPIENLDFLIGLPQLEYLEFGFIRFLSEFPIFKPMSSVSKLKEIRLGMSAAALEDFAYLEAKLPHIIGAKRPPYLIFEEKHRELRATDMGWGMPVGEFEKLAGRYISNDGKRFITKPAQLYLLGKGTRSYSGPIEKIMHKVEEHKKKYEELVKSFS